MKFISFYVSLSLALVAHVCLVDPVAGQQESEFVDLFASGDFSQWRVGKKGEGWSIKNGVVTLEKPRSGSLISRRQYKHFELRFEWRIAEGGNSGVIYRSQKGRGLEYQLLDDQRHQRGKNSLWSTAAIYELAPSDENKKLEPAGEWNNSRIIADGNSVEHWLNGEVVSSIETLGDEWDQKYRKSKYLENGLNNFANVASPISFQDHGAVVSFRNVRLRELWEAETPSDHPDFPMMLGRVAPSSKFIDDAWYIWGGSMVRDKEGICHLFYSRWPRDLKHNAWVTHSEIAHATSENPTGPYRHVDVALPTRGKELWDGLCTHNPTVHEFEGKYYLYYMGNTGDHQPTEKLNWNHRNNQRIGVAVAEHPDGPWQRFDKPLIDISADENAPDALMTSNPSILRRGDGTYVLIYKAVGKKRKRIQGGPVVHLAATSDSPTGPFKKHLEPLFVIEGSDFPAEDPYIWFQGGTCWAIVNDHKGAFTKTGEDCLALFHSKDGLNWSVSENPLVLNRKIHWQGGKSEAFHRLERPQLFFENGVPVVLFCAAEKTKQKLHSFNVHIPITWKK